MFSNWLFELEQVINNIKGVPQHGNALGIVYLDDAQCYVVPEKDPDVLYKHVYGKSTSNKMV